MEVIGALGRAVIQADTVGPILVAPVILADQAVEHHGLHRVPPQGHHRFGPELVLGHHRFHEGLVHLVFWIDDASQGELVLAGLF